ncbi:chorismate transformation enzyme, FkbO/Hyg5 family [Candidatus Nitrospira salsa]
MIQYIHPAQLSRILSDHSGHVLALVDYGKNLKELDRDEGLTMAIDLPQRGHGQLVEMWTSPHPVSICREKDVAFAFDDDILLGSIEVSQKPHVSLEQTTLTVYQNILRSITNMGYIHLARMWNYFPLINAEENKQERYQRFCVGRHQAFSEHREEFQAILPAASAIGTYGNLFQVYFVAGKIPSTHVENPRQISAYHYPKLYGPRSPSFARGTLFTMQNTLYFFVSGTASIVGHATQHIDDPREQTVEAILNIQGLVDHANKELEKEFGQDFMLDLLKVYVRNIKDTKIVRETLEEHFGKEQPVLYLEGEMCRKDLLVEIEAIFRSKSQLKCKSGSN